MSIIAKLPCFTCGATLRNVDVGVDNQPESGTEFRTMGHYGSTFWDSVDGEELVLNICDECLRAHTERLAQQKRYLPIRCEGLGGFGQQWVDRPMVPYTGNRDDTTAQVEFEELGTPLPRVDWAPNIEDLKVWATPYVTGGESI